MKEGRFIKTYYFDFLNPLGVLKYANQLSTEQIADILNLMNSVDTDYEKTIMTCFKNESECKEYLERLQKAIDPYTRYIENYKQMKDAEQFNERIEYEILFVKKNGFSPEIIKKKRLTYIFANVKQILEGLEVRNDKTTVAHVINWIKKLGFKKSDVNTENKSFTYTMEVMTSNYKNKFDASFVFQKKEDGTYDVKFFYSYPENEGIQYNETKREFTPNSGWTYPSTMY